MNPNVWIGIGAVAIVIALIMFFNAETMSMLYPALVAIGGVLFGVVGFLKKREM